jgi:hypothetical protein
MSTDKRPPRIVIVLPGQWPRALLRAELREQGYDALGAESLEEALVYPAREEGRGPVAMLIVDATALAQENGALLQRLRERHQDPLPVLIAPGGGGPPPGDWAAVLYRPLRREQLYERVRRLLPLPAGVGPVACVLPGTRDRDPPAT